MKNIQNLQLHFPIDRFQNIIESLLSAAFVHLSILRAF